MRICYVSNSHLPSNYANSVHVINMASALAASGADVTLLALRADGGSKPSADAEAVCRHYGVEANFQIAWLPNPTVRGRSLLSALCAWSKLRKLRPNLVIGRHAKGCFAAALNGIPTVYETHKPYSAHSKVDKFCLSRLFESSSFRGLVTISNPLREMLKSEAGVSDDHILVAPDAARLPTALRPAELGAAGRLQVGYVGAFYPGRGIDLLVASAEQLPDIDFHLVGGTRASLEEWYGEVPELQNVKFHGYQPPVRAAELRAGCDVLVAPYSRATLIAEGIDTTRWMSPLKVFEYMASGKPILCSDLPVLREVLEHERNALLLSPDQVAPWIDALRRLQADPDYARELGRRAFEDFERHYTWEQRAERVVSFAHAKNK